MFKAGVVFWESLKYIFMLKIPDMIFLNTWHNG